MRVSQETLTAQQIAAINLIATGCTWDDVIEVLKVNTKMVARWKRHRQFRQELSYAKKELGVATRGPADRLKMT